VNLKETAMTENTIEAAEQSAEKAAGGHHSEPQKPEPAFVDVDVNGERTVKIARGVYTTEELIKLLGIPAGHIVNIVLPNGEFNELEPGEKITIARDTDVVSHLPVGGAS